MNRVHNTLNTARVLRTLESRSSVCMPIPGKDSPANSFVSDVGRMGPLLAPPPVPLERPGVIKVMGEVRIRGTWTYSGILYALLIENSTEHFTVHCTVHCAVLYTARLLPSAAPADPNPPNIPPDPPPDPLPLPPPE